MIFPSGTIPLCALVLGLGGCAYSPGPVDWVAEGDSSFIVTCAPSACAQRATAICNAQGFSRYEILERRRGDDLGEGGGIVIQCNGERPALSPTDVGLYRLKGPTGGEG